MKRLMLAGSILALLVCVYGNAEDTVVKSNIVSIGLFKNGLAVVKREAKLPGAGTFIIEDVPEPIHGTWSVQAGVPLETRIIEREITGSPRNTNEIDLQKALAGKQVTIHFRDGQIPPATGKVEALKEDKNDRVWNRRFEQPNYNRYNAYYAGEVYGAAAATQARFLVLQTEQGRVFLDTGMIAYLKSEGKDDIRVTRRVPVLQVTAPKDANEPVTATISYLTKGIAWAPSYRVDITDPKTLSIEQSAVIKNELEDLEGAEMQLISGYPSVQFGHVVSPFSTRTTWSEFFAMSTQNFRQSDQMAQQVVYQSNSRNDRGQGFGAVPTGEGVDIHYQKVGPRSLKEGESMSLSIATERTPYERVVEWIVPDTRNEHGRQIEEYQRQQNPEKYDDAAWDALRFKNPFKFPMTTAPATVICGDRFNGQRMSFWVNSGEDTCLQVTKALSVRTRSSEKEEEGKRDEAVVAGYTYRKCSVLGELVVNNHRNEQITVLIRRQFSGDLVNADGAPKKTLREEGVYSVNQRYELSWTLTLKPGEEKTLTYKYHVLVR